MNNFYVNHEDIPLLFSKRGYLKNHNYNEVF